MEKDLRFVILSVALSSLLKRARITPNQLKAELATFIKAMPDDAKGLSQAEIDFCIASFEGLCAGAPATKSHS